MLTKKVKDILILGEGSNQVLDDTTLTAEVKYPINFKQPKKKKICIKCLQFKVKDSEIKYYTLCLGNFPKIFQLKVLFLAYNLKTARINRSAIIVIFCHLQSFVFACIKLDKELKTIL